MKGEEKKRRRKREKENGARSTVNAEMEMRLFACKTYNETEKDEKEAAEAGKYMKGERNKRMGEEKRKMSQGIR